MPTEHVHVITPGDHFSPLTGSAVPTVVHGLASGRAADLPRPRVMVSRGTYPERYDSAEITEYEQRRSRRFDRHIDALLSRVGAPRMRARRSFAASLVTQRDWPSSVIFGHNAVQLMPSVDRTRHTPVLYAHNHLLRTYSPRESARTLRGVAAVVCVSHFLAGQMAGHLPADLAGRLEVVHNGVDSSFFRPDPDRDHGDRLQIVFVGRVLPEKGADVVIRALRLLDRVDIALTVVGAHGFAPQSPLTEYERDLRRLADPLGSRVAFRPFLPRREVAELLRSADVSVVPSRWAEPFALTALEGMAAGAAVIGSEIGGIPEAMGDAGIRVPPDDPAALAGALESLADDRSLLATVRRTCREHAVMHDWVQVAGKLDALIQRVS